MDKIIPLCDDLAEWSARSWWRALFANLFPKNCLAMRLKTQLKARPNPWGIGLWKDAETEKIAKRCAEIFIDYFDKCPNDRLIPQDRMEMVAALNDTGDIDDVMAVEEIEDEFDCTIPDGFYTEETTFADFVECVKAGRDKAQPQKEKGTAKGWFSYFGLCVFLFLCWGVIPGFVFYKLGVRIWSIIHDGWSACPVKSLIGESIAAFVCLGFFCILTWSFIKRRKGPDPRITKM